ncbi:16S rRNA (cytosine(967)-C(5))-methyltransferase RsmB [Candidatus Methanoperedens nitratireducens]|uniref:16S rRNA (cytosine(967)-C(5))-methyltransferase n=1 Tax=Candidatus Methanoperedens nitratireducens TaxID=1392998 RepID=A0A284VP87_9EURY|nr:16S rRNA (cytosine(967)-C(5))-methyltransferase RsmB [Candidatus Methanoperedens nitroreducens]SNQ61028.1 putative Ribosomal RNA small subunit methyltransferase B [Candidatus Methanoperedens nitroreducens]
MGMHTSGKNSIFIRQKAYFAIMRLLNSAIGEGKYPDLLLGGLFKSEEFSSAEKAIIVEIGYGILRHMGRIDYIIENASRAAISRVGLNTLNILRLCTYQAVFMDASPAGIINNAVALSSLEKESGGFVKRTVEGILRNKEVIYPDKEKAPLEYISIYHSHPRWIVEKWFRELNDVRAVGALCSTNNLDPPLTIRTNPLKTDREPLQRLLQDEGYGSSPTAFSPCGLVVDKKEDIFKTGAFKSGLFEVQDEGSQLITMLTGAKPGGYVVDACAGNGGKSLFLSELMKTRGIILAMDTHAGKLANLRRRAGRSGASNIHTMTPEDAKLKQLKGTADCVFIDAPCSGMGVFRRNPDSKWRLTERDISELAEKQKEILREYSELVKPGGRLVYATCTISREENEGVVRAFLEENEEFCLVPVIEVNPELFSKFMTEKGFFRSLPHVHGTDGFFGAVMRRK